MTTASPAGPASSLHRAALLAGILAVIAGFLGMHILSGSHGMHSHAAVAGSGGHAEQAADPASAPAHGQHPSHNAGPTTPPSCVCQGGCAEKPAAHVDCTPSPAGASLGAPQPGTTLLAIQSWTAAPAGRQAHYAFLPGTPTPRDLSISRT
ncbi:hypothetical protein [Arthrobacter sp. TB 26]|uniref:hypothetical protein n=1 Tax=Arthrobacter sp. TB 26 TaxID=494420 RepID=UPI00046268CA|nr:hypothetical protein [Arthrobacter sp. TB 26]